MAITIPVEIVSAESRLFSGKGEYIYVPGKMGEMSIAFGHAPLLSFLDPGVVRIINCDVQDVFYVHGGFVEVQPQKVTVLADVAERAADLDEAEAEESRRRAQQMLDDRNAEMDYAAAMVELSKAVAQLRAISQLKKKY